ncbi:MAG: Mur ligase family protein [Treponema sp.]|nr:Mur ligase family protein [Treponema sp.]
MTESKKCKKNAISKESEKSEKIINFEKWLDSYLNFEKTPKKNIFWLETMNFFCSKFKNPENAERCFHVAGSKGKGSVSMFIASILKEAGFNAGLYTSPHILDFLERVSLAGDKFSNGIYEKAADELMRTVEAVKEEELPGGRGITWFELVTIFAFLVFRQAKTDFAVYEVGLGGRLDSTNVVNPVCACIGPIELEHTEFLGDTVEKIAAEKGGIIKPASKVVIAKQVPSVRKVFEEIAKERNAEVFFVDDEIKNLQFKIEKISLSVAESAREAKENARNKNHPVMSVSFESKYFSRPVHAKLKMLGKFQAQNAALAALAVKISLPEISEETIENGLSNAVLPARFEVVPSPENYENIPYLVLDGAHTVNSETFTMETMRETGLLGIDSKNTDYTDCADKTDLNKPVLLFACAADKDVKDIAPLFKGKFRKIFLTKPGNVKISDTKKMEDAFDENGIPYDFDADFSSQIKKALNFADEKKSVLLVTGSFYLVAEAKKILLEN